MNKRNTICALKGYDNPWPYYAWAPYLIDDRVHTTEQILPPHDAHLWLFVRICSRNCSCMGTAAHMHWESTSQETTSQKRQPWLPAIFVYLTWPARIHTLAYISSFSCSSFISLSIPLTKKCIWNQKNFITAHCKHPQYPSLEGSTYSYIDWLCHHAFYSFYLY